ncbi:TetR/AcrR family transcriptional regulator [Pseudomonas neustonica]|uniref:TetR/AcrR family transcriptional regulator n=1 Tax=Pseudomonas neustonica TaxID=2487346 RepID=A0ABX9XLH7_9PSED|nr:MULTISPECIES: TetR/AcrR family transcriptional regulator [Pseudomonas]ROZ86055.1 TetR/AcrR family transcriptional regulator [Pseudomonas sp. SSM44]ROZ87780.1 TetR/AcrR family transcriptional regulator [Pseudomonas neustonica]|tara:strand:- start:3301 stop:3924 length:624 start_codon:yes stop_codon:yes gene_type:complete
MPAPAKANPRGRPKGRAVLSQQDWFNAATEAILEGGFDQLRVLPLAKRLKVTRGSFYWHFDDLGSFIHLFLDQWQALRMRGLRYWQPGKDPSLSPEQEVDRVLTLMFEGPAVEFKRMKVEFAIRDYAQRDDYARNIVATVDNARVEQSAQLLEPLVAPGTARAMALIQYSTVLGSVLLFRGQLGGDESLTTIRNHWQQLLNGPQADA